MNWHEEHEKATKALLARGFNKFQIENSYIGIVDRTGFYIKDIYIQTMCMWTILRLGIKP
jgi:hypothetical protein